MLQFLCHFLNSRLFFQLDILKENIYIWINFLFAGIYIGIQNTFIKTSKTLLDIIFDIIPFSVLRCFFLFECFINILLLQTTLTLRYSQQECLPRQLEFNNVSVFQCKYIIVISLNEKRLLFCMERQFDHVKLQGTEPYAHYVINNIHVSALRCPSGFLAISPNQKLKASN